MWSILEWNGHILIGLSADTGRAYVYASDTTYIQISYFVTERTKWTQQNYILKRRVKG